MYVWWWKLQKYSGAEFAATITVLQFKLTAAFGFQNDNKKSFFMRTNHQHGKQMMAQLPNLILFRHGKLVVTLLRQHNCFNHKAVSKWMHYKQRQMLLLALLSCISRKLKWTKIPLCQHKIFLCFFFLTTKHLTSIHSLEDLANSLLLKIAGYHRCYC